jgi:hypothetical protein
MAQVTLQVNSPEAGYLNIRDTPATSGALVTRVNDRTTLAALDPADVVQSKVGQQGEWLAVQTPDGHTGYAAAWYLTLAPPVPPPPPTATQAVVVNSPDVPLKVRSGPGVQNAILAQAPHGTVLRALGSADAIRAQVGQQNQWLQVQTPDGVTGYCAAWYCKLADAAPAPEGAVPVSASYGSLSVVNWEPAQRQAQEHGDLNLALRGYTLADAALKVKDINGETDPSAPQLAGVLCMPRAPAFQAAYRVHDWNWGGNCPGDPIDDPEVTFVVLAAMPGESLCLPDRLGGDVGEGYKALVLYAAPQRITLKYTREDNVIAGYTLHVENIEVDANLLALYQQLDSQGRHALPAVRAGQAFGRASSDRVGLAIRDTGAFMDPRSRKDWWRGY